MTEKSEQPKPKKYSGYGYHGGGRKPTGVKRVSFSVSCTKEQREKIKALADEAGKTVSALIIEALL